MSEERRHQLEPYNAITTPDGASQWLLDAIDRRDETIPTGAMSHLADVFDTTINTIVQRVYELSGGTVTGSICANNSLQLYYQTTPAPADE